jgi:hypothetical protein
VLKNRMRTSRVLVRCQAYRNRQQSAQFGRAVGAGKRHATTVGRLLKPQGYSLKTNVKRLIGKVHL